MTLGPASAQNAPHTPQEIAQHLNHNGTVVQVPASGKAKQSIQKESPTFPFPDGESRVALFRLPEYSVPYTLTVASGIGGFGFGKDVFVPTGLLFDGDFQRTRDLPESDFAQKSNTLVATISFDDQQKGDRYLLLFTRGALVGERMDKVHPQTNTAGAVPALISFKLVKAQRAANGSIQVEAKPTKRKK